MGAIPFNLFKGAGVATVAFTDMVTGGSSGSIPWSDATGVRDAVITEIEVVWCDGAGAVGVAQHKAQQCRLSLTLYKA